MKVTVRIRGVNLLHKHFSAKADIQGKSADIDPGLTCTLSVTDASTSKYRGTIETVNKKADRSAILIKFPRDVNLLTALYSVQYSEVDLSLLIEEKVPEHIFKEAQVLLHAYANKAGRTPEDILQELTAFKPGVEGRRDLMFVSLQQQLVVIDKLKELIGAANVSH